MISIITVYEKMTDLKHLHIDTSRLYSIMTSLIIYLKGRVSIVNIDIMYQNVQHSRPYKVFCRKKRTLVELMLT